mmetsp:Transcript_74530/g.159736  ORF Transcript_74530/g.159736 Transcript_74530/m.159736 type:complete len:570 (+) Transcript_74530:534-2243(+)
MQSNHCPALDDHWHPMVLLHVLLGYGLGLLGCLGCCLGFLGQGRLPFLLSIGGGGSSCVLNRWRCHCALVSGGLLAVVALPVGEALVAILVQSLEELHGIHVRKGWVQGPRTHHELVLRHLAIVLNVHLLTSLHDRARPLLSARRKGRRDSREVVGLCLRQRMFHNRNELRGLHLLVPVRIKALEGPRRVPLGEWRLECLRDTKELVEVDFAVVVLVHVRVGVLRRRVAAAHRFRELGQGDRPCRRGRCGQSLVRGQSLQVLRSHEEVPDPENALKLRGGKPPVLIDIESLEGILGLRRREGLTEALSALRGIEELADAHIAVGICIQLSEDLLQAIDGGIDALQEPCRCDGCRHVLPVLGSGDRGRPCSHHSTTTALRHSGANRSQGLRCLEELAELESAQELGYVHLPVVICIEALERILGLLLIQGRHEGLRALDELLVVHEAVVVLVQREEDIPRQDIGAHPLLEVLHCQWGVPSGCRLCSLEEMVHLERAEKLRGRDPVVAVGIFTLEDVLGLFLRQRRFELAGPLDEIREDQKASVVDVQRFESILGRCERRSHSFPEVSHRD